MTAPVETKTLRVKPDTHTTVHNIANDLNGNADDAIRWLLNPNTVRVVVTPQQRQRWEDAAASVGIPVAEWVTSRVEAALHFQADPTTIMSTLREIQHDIRTSGTA